MPITWLPSNEASSFELFGQTLDGATTDPHRFNQLRRAGETFASVEVGKGDKRVQQSLFFMGHIQLSNPV
jgi:hypothetical protein